MKSIATLLVILPGFTGLFAQVAPPNPGLLVRRYQEGERLTYRMEGVNNGWRYELRATGVVKKDSGGEYVEEYAWSDLRSNGSPFTLPPASLEFRQILSLARSSTSNRQDNTGLPS